MDLPINEFFEVFEQLCRNRQLKVAAINSIKGGIITGLAAFVGGLMVGPAGLAIGLFKLKIKNHTLSKYFFVSTYMQVCKHKYINIILVYH